MNNNGFKEITDKVFKSGNPAMLYIGINVIVFLLVGIGSLFLARGLGDDLIRQYLAFPADFSQWPVRFYTFVTYVFFHKGLFHILFNLLWLYWMGNLFLDFLKPRQFQVVYWGGAIAGALAFALIYNLSPQLNAGGATLIGASAAVMAIFSAVATLVPNYSIRLLLFGDVKLKYLLLVYILIDIVGTSPGSGNIGGSLAHLGGALFGFVFIKLLQNGTDLSNFLVKKPTLKVIKNNAPKKKTVVSNQAEIDAILDKISKSGYDKLTTKEKQILFDASKN
ncbi:rhomboid family intramembrane serine protease [Pedobacter xixiisoli]|uniref:Membrane associated serine protease, rhomboid family n=1 Tax=Pedobacter xixiisoli TaxID=1476464 RepID=A0A286AF51_9SPHI|nr:rhomboid family intramembrane serine protease [Pedobacter xixiisoli]SOD20529.1 Membrane associated serine protease, rhomboid family [Pedobacter xixiisoli]